MRLEDGSREARSGQEGIGLLHGRHFPVRVEEPLDARESATHLGQGPRPELHQGLRPRDGDGGVPQAPGGETPLHSSLRLLLPKHTPPRNYAIVAIEGRARLDPAVLALGRRGLATQQHDPVGMPLERAGHFLDMGHEGGLAQDEVIGWEDREGRGRVAPGDPLRGVQNRGRGAPVFRLNQNVGRLRGALELLGDVPGVPAHRDHHGTVRRDAEGGPVKRLPQQASRPEQLHELLRPILAEHPANEGPETNPLAAGEHDAPHPPGFGHRGYALTLRPAQRFSWRGNPFTRRSATIAGSSRRRGRRRAASSRCRRARCMGGTALSATSATSGERKNASTNQVTGSRPFSQATQAVTDAPPTQAANPNRVRRNPSLTKSPINSFMVLASDTQQEQDDDETQRHTQEPEQNEWHYQPPAAARSRRVR